MFIHKIGKTKHKFKARLTLTNVTHKGAVKGQCFKVKIERGSNNLQAISLPSKRGISKFKQEELIIPMTLFYNEEEDGNPYLEKQATFKLYECEEDGSHTHKIATKDIDLAQFAQLGSKDVQITLGEAVLELVVYLERQDDDSKSVNTFSSNNDDKKITNDKKSQQASLSSKKQEVSARSRSPDKIKPSDIPDNKKQRPQLSLQQALREVKQQSTAKDDDDYQFEPTTQIEKQQPPPPKSKTVEFKNGESQELQSFILKRALKQKQEEIYSYKKQNEQLQKSIEKLIEENYAKKGSQNKIQGMKEVQQLKANLTKKMIEIDSLETKNKSITEREKQYESTIVELRQKVAEYRARLSEAKYREAFMMQQLFELGDKGVLQIANKYLAK